jgi:hypothetical protein
MREEYESLRVFCNGHLRLVPLILISGNLMHPRRSRLPSIKNYSGAAAADAGERGREGEQQEVERIDMPA